MKAIKTEKGISLVSLIIYLSALTITIGIIARISAYFYTNIDIITEDTESISEFIKFNTYITKEVNIEENYIKDIDANGTYVIFNNTNNQYTFLDNAIYMNNVKICSNIEFCVFSSIDKNNLQIELIINKKPYVNVYSILDK